MVTRPRKVLSVLLASAMIASMCALPVAVSAADTATEISDAGALASHYKTNPSGKGVKKTITIDGDASDWSEDMLIAQGAAWDVANHWKGGHENCVLDTYALFGAWDDENLYVGWQMVNTTDTWANPGDGPLSDGGRVLDVPLILALSLDENSTSMSNKNTSGTAIWGKKMGLQFDTHVDRLLYMSGKPGLGKPSMFKAVDAQGNTDYDDGCVGFADGGIEYKMATTNICSKIIGLDGSDSPADVSDDGADWVDFKTKNHDTKYDSFYEIKIPLSTLGITSSHIESNGVGAMLVATRGESALDCIPYDLSMVDNATGDYSADPSTSLEKEDTDIVTATLARIGNDGGVVIPTSKPTSKPTTTPSNLTSATTATSAPSTGVTGTKSVTVAAGDVVTFNVKATSTTKISAYRMTTEYPSAAFSLDTSYSTDGVNTPGSSDGNEVVNKSTAGIVKTAVTAGTSYDVSSGKILQTVKLKAKKAGTFKISYTMDELLDPNCKELVSGGKVNSAVTMSMTASVKSPAAVETGSTTATFAAGDTVTVNVNLKSATKLYGFKTDLTYDSTLLTVKSVTFPNFSGGTTMANTDTAGKIATVGVGSPTKTFDYTTSKNLVRVTFTAKKAGTSSKIAYLMKEVIGLDAVNQFDETTGKSTVSTTTSSISAKTTTASTGLGSITKSVTVKKGQIVTFTAKVKTSVKFNKYVLTTKYNTAAFALYTDYSSDGVNTMKAAQGGKESVDTATAGTIKATVTAATNSPYTAANATNMIIVKFTAKKAGTFDISATLDSMLNDSNKAMTASQVTVTGSASATDLETKVAGASKSIQVKQGEIIVYTMKIRTATKFKTYQLTTTYDSAAFELYTPYSNDGVTTIKLTQGGTEKVNTATAGKVVVQATCASDTPYKASSTTNLQIIRFKAKKAGTFTIGGVINTMTNSSGKAMTGSDLTFVSNTASVVVPFTGSQSVTVTKGQLVNYYVTVTLPNSGYDISGWTVDMNYDSDLFSVNTSFANKKGFAVGDAAINYATGATTTSATLPGGTLATANFNTEGTATILDANSKGLGLKGKTTKLVCIQLKAKKAGTGVLSYVVKKFVDTKSQTTYINDKYQYINGSTFKMTVDKK